MPANDLGKFLKYSPEKKEVFFDVEKTISQTVDHAEKLGMKGILLTLLADDFFRENKGSISASVMYTKSVVPPHNHDYFEINYVISGKCVEYIGNRTFILDEGDFLFMPPVVHHAPNPVGDSICVNILMKSEWVSTLENRIITYDLDSFLTRMQKQNTYMVFKAKEKKAFSTANELYNLFIDRKSKPYRELFAENLAEKLLLELSECDFSETYYTSPVPRVSSDTHSAILQYITNNISTATLSDVADHFGYSKTHLSRLIKNHTGNGFSKYIMLQRILRAEQLLSKTDIPIGKIPAMIGLDSNEYFSRVFKKYNNVSPFQYRNMHK